MNQEAAFRALEEQKLKLHAKIPSGAPLMRTRYLKSMVEDEVGAAAKHLQALYECGLAVGPDFAALREHETHPKYAFWLEGIHRHLRSCEAVLAEQPAGG